MTLREMVCNLPSNGAQPGNFETCVGNPAKLTLISMCPWKMRVGDQLKLKFLMYHDIYLVFSSTHLEFDIA